MLDREALLATVKLNLQRAQERMRTQANCHRRNKEFEVGNGVYVKLQPYQQSSIAHRLSNKLAKKYYGPYQIAALVGNVAYRLLLPLESRIYPVFHISILKLCPNPAEAIPSPTTNCRILFHTSMHFGLANCQDK